VTVAVLTLNGNYLHFALALFNVSLNLYGLAVALSLLLFASLMCDFMVVQYKSKVIRRICQMVRDLCLRLVPINMLMMLLVAIWLIGRLG
jgi:hypothetical protein